MALQHLVLAILLVGSQAFNLPGIPTDFTQDEEVLSAISEDLASHFADEYLNYMKTGVESASLRNIANQMSKAHSKKDLFTADTEDLSLVDQFVACTSCRVVSKIMIGSFRNEDGELNGPNREENSKKLSLEICKRLNLQTEEVCAGIIEMNYPFWEYILDNSIADTRTLCGSLPYRFCSIKQEEFNFSLKIDNKEGLLDKPKAEKPLKTGDDLMVLHLTDIHIDPNYRNGTLAECDEPMCCNNPPKFEVPAHRLAGYWGDYRDCDAPTYMVADALNKIKTTHSKIDYIYHTGDVVPHNIWSTTKKDNIILLTEVDQLVAETFPNVPVYSVMGNHEPHPTNLFGGPEVPDHINVRWLYVHVWNLWSKWLPESAKDTVLRGGYYTVTPKPGFRIIALNNMDCYLYNWWVLHESSVAMEQLNWLHDTLLEAEKQGEHVHILAHIPSGSRDCWPVWAREYNRIIERFSKTISAIFNGHTHKDEMSVHYSAKGHAMMVSWNGGSLTPYSQKNANYKIYEVEPKTLQVVDHHTYIYNLTDANLHGSEHSPEWFKEYQFTETFTDDLSPAGLDNLLVKMAENPKLLKRFWELKMTSADPTLRKGCNNKCLMKTICSLARSVHDQNQRCKELQAILEENLEEETTTTPSTTTSTEKPDGEPDAAASIQASVTALMIALLASKYII